MLRQIAIPVGVAALIAIALTDGATHLHSEAASKAHSEAARKSHAVAAPRAHPEATSKVHAEAAPKANAGAVPKARTEAAPKVHSEGAPNGQRLMPGDRIGIKLFDEEQISGSYQIDAAGTITLPIVGSIEIMGLTLEGAQRAIEGVLGNGFYTRPVVGVRVDELRPIYVHGYVKTPGAYPYRTGLTAMGAVALAGGAPSASTTALLLTTDLFAAQERVDVLAARRAELTVRVAGLETLRAGGKDLDLSRIPDDIKADRRFAELVGNERRKLEVETRLLDDELDVLRKQQPQFAKEREAIESEILAQSKLLELSSNRYADLDTLRKKGLARTAAMMEPAQQEAMAHGTVARLKVQKVRNDIEIAGIEFKIVEKHNLFRQKAAQLLNDTRRDLHETDIQLAYARKVLELRRQAAGYGSEASAPQTFVIQRLVDGKPRTIQGSVWTVIEPGDIVEVRNFDPGLGQGPGKSTTEIPGPAASSKAG